MSIEVRIVGDAVVDSFTEQTVVAGEWVEHAACSTTSPPDLFFPERGASTREAKAVCAGCPVRVDPTESVRAAARVCRRQLEALLAQEAPR